MNTQLRAAVTDAKNGDRAAFETLYNTYRDRLFFFALKYTGSREAAEDIVSETFITAMEKLPTLRDGEAFGGWLYSIAYNKCMDHCKENSERVSLDDDNIDAVINSPVMLPDDYAVNEQLKSSLRDIIDGLSPDARSAVIMYYYEEMSVEDVSKAMNTSENVTKQRLFRARKTIRKKIEKLVGSGVMFAAVPLGAVLNNTAELAETSATVSGAATAGTAKLAGTGFAVKAAAVGAAAVMAVGIPIGLSKLSRNGDHRTEDSSAIERLSDDSSRSENTSLSDDSSRSDDSRREPAGNTEDGAYAVLNYLRAELDAAETKQLTDALTPIEGDPRLTFCENGDWTLSYSLGEESGRYMRVPSDKGWYIVDGGFKVYEDSPELDSFVMNAITAQNGGSGGSEAIDFSVECEEPETEQEYVDAGIKCLDAWLTNLEKENSKAYSEGKSKNRYPLGHSIAMTGDSGSNVTNYLASGIVNGEKQFLVEICFELNPRRGNGSLEHFWQEGRYTAAGVYWSGYYICGRFTYKDGRVTLTETGTRDAVDRMKEGLNGIITDGYRNFFEFARRPDLTEAINNSFVPYGRVTVSKNLTQTMDGTAINVDIYAPTTDSQTDTTYTAIWDKRAYIDGKATYSTGLYFTDGGTGHVPDTLPKDFRLTFDNYDGDGNPDFCCRYDADQNGTYYVLESIQSDGRIFNLSGRAYQGGIYIAGCTDPSPRLQKTEDHKYTGWKLDGSRYYPTDENGNEIQLPELNMYSDRFDLPNDLKLYAADENKVTCFVWNNTADPLTTDGSYSIERLEGGNWVTEAEGLSVSPVTIAPREHAEITYDISALENRYNTAYRIVQKSGQITGRGKFFCAGKAVQTLSVTAAPICAGSHTGSFTVADIGVEKTKITSVTVNVDGREVPLIIDKSDNGEYTYVGEGLPDKAGKYTLTVNGTASTELVVVPPTVSDLDVDISAEYDDGNILLTVKPSKDLKVSQVYACKEGSKEPIQFSSTSDDGTFKAGEERQMTLVNVYMYLYFSDERFDEVYEMYKENDNSISFKQYGIEAGLSEEELKERITEIFTLNEDDNYKLIVTLKVGGTNYMRIV